MSGGHWNYQQERLSSFAYDLSKSDSPVIQATGDLLEAIAAELNKADRFYSLDSSEWDDAPLAALVGNDRVLSVAVDEAKKARDEIDRLLAKIAAE